MSDGVKVVLGQGDWWDSQGQPAVEEQNIGRKIPPVGCAVATA